MHRDAVTTTVLLGSCADPGAACRELATAMLARRTPMPAHERADLETLLDACRPAALSWLPETIPVKETRAVVLAHALRKEAGELLPRHAGTATDVLRVLHTLMGGDPGLRIRPERRTSLPRAVRRAVLACLDGMPYLLEDLLRHRERWKHMAEVLHPHEQHARFPGAALAFAALRGTRLDPGTAFGRALLERAAGHPELEVRDGRVRAKTFASRVETALADGRHADAVTLLAHRPGELLRRLSRLLRVTYADGGGAAADGARAAETPLKTLEGAVRRVTPGVLSPRSARSGPRGWPTWSRPHPSVRRAQRSSAWPVAAPSPSPAPSGSGSSCTGRSRRAPGWTWTCRWRCSSRTGASRACATTRACASARAWCTRAT
ncbi:hypothetical protein [Nonomuraea diastatica]|uniref:Uncharacterized protein n=1 Tax=Nonomuraea diastatica TaxID=1848329 RepID=A0A4R4WKY3_9ACTN|nr:hypothetical protein [Nonomuraea diastatica]TDD19161.1 hypothetical protein E1294_21755 [Nonomuraea diastatica]